MTADVIRLLIIIVYVYMLYEGNADSTAEFTDQLSVIKTFVTDNANCQDCNHRRGF